MENLFTHKNRQIHLVQISEYSTIIFHVENYDSIKRNMKCIEIGDKARNRGFCCHKNAFDKCSIMLIVVTHILCCARQPLEDSKFLHDFIALDVI